VDQKDARKIVVSVKGGENLKADDLPVDVRESRPAPFPATQVANTVDAAALEPVGRPSGISMSDNTRSGMLSCASSNARAALPAVTTSCLSSLSNSDSTDTMLGSSSAIRILAIAGDGSSAARSGQRQISG
jgi:hypothetical protein